MIRSLVKNIRNRFLNKEEQTGATPTPGASAAVAEVTATQPRPKRKRRKKTAKPDTKQSSATPQSEPTPWDISQFRVEPAADKIRFHDLNLPDELMHAIHDLGFQYCTPIQAEILPKVLDGTDATGKAQTGTGKSAAFLATILARLSQTPLKEKRRNGTPRALILAPTRELVAQIEKDAVGLAKHMEINIVSVFGGTGYDSQRRKAGDNIVDIIVATPGRLLDFMRQKIVRLDMTEILVIDEADRMLDMGFIPDVRTIVYATPDKSKRQTLFFSATLTDDVTRLANQWTKNPVTVEIEPEQVTVDTVDQQVFMITTDQKFPLLYNLITGQKLERVMIFCNRRDETRRLYEKLSSYDISCAILSGDISQDKRTRTLENFRGGKINVLVATDVAGRGIHIKGVSHVVNYHLPQDPEDYVHRIGRTGRAGATGISVSFADEDESFYLPEIEEFIGRKLPCVYPEEELLVKPPPAPKKLQRSDGRKK
ncbi:MAG: ATP-dependent RNA helicase RhlB, partial [Desulfobulbaceae bacterium]|nr:ATP-dependent RNA helicase RhlB [Desulfobulbaceae bacterium]